MLKEYITKAIEELENRTPPSKPKKRDEKFDILVDLIANESPIRPADLRITEEEYKSRIESIIEAISGSDDPISEFHSRLDEYEAEIEDRLREFTILFPLNFWTVNAEGFEEPVQIRDLKFIRVSRSYWDEHVEEAKKKDTFDEFVEDLPTRRNFESPFGYLRYWRVEYEAASIEYAVNKVTNMLGVLLGKIAFSAHFNRITFSHRNTSWKYGITTLQYPICYIVLEDGEYINYYRSYDFTPRWKFSLSGSSQREAFAELYPMLPDFKGELDEIDDHLLSAFNSYFDAMSEPDQEQALLNFWRCLEAATLSDEKGYSASEPLKRARASMRPNEIEISDNRIERLKNKRNRLVHKGEIANVTEGDITHLRNLSESSILFLVTEKDNYSFEELDFIFKYGGKPRESILQAKADRERQIEDFEHEVELFEQIMEWLDLES